MLTVKNTKKVREATKAEKIFGEDAFYGPFLEFTQVEYEKTAYIYFGRTYSEDAKYADKTYLQLVVDATTEIMEGVGDKDLYLCIWGKKIFIPYDADKFEISEILIDFILRNFSK